MVDRREDGTSQNKNRDFVSNDWGVFEDAKWLEHLGGGRHGSAECPSCRSHDRAKCTKALCRDA
jgi:hypothetical protein